MLGLIAPDNRVLPAPRKPPRAARWSHEVAARWFALPTPQHLVQFCELNTIASASVARYYLAILAAL